MSKAKPTKKKPVPKPAAKKPTPKAKPAKAAPKGKPVVSGKKPVAATGGTKPKGITIVDNKSMKRPNKPPKKVVVMPSLGAPLIAPGKKWKPLIQSGPNAPKIKYSGIDLQSLKGKSPFSKKDLDHYKQILIKKRTELAGDIEHMEGAALKDTSGSLSHLPQHAAEQGSDAYDQSLSLDIAGVDRKLIKEIDDALRRIADHSFGICEMTGKPISKERLEELPWTRYSIDGAREREKRTFYIPRSSSESATTSSRSAAADA